jgi:RimJ/RimL family protein N-acetyltransferase
MEPERLTTARLVLEPLRVAHAREMVSVLDDPLLRRYVGGESATLGELEARYARQVRGRSADGAQRWVNWVVRLRSSDAAVGFVQATIDAESGVADLAWVVGSRFQGRGLAGEAASAMASWLRRSGVTGLTAHIHPGNSASEGVARSVGLEPTATVVRGEVRWVAVPTRDLPDSQA